MNDAVESFLVFQEARLTGEYLPDFEGDLSASLSEDVQGYVLVLHQDTTVCTLFFQDLVSETHLFDYGKTGHFWVKKWEYLRQLEYRIAILHDKLEYLGTEYCNKTEQMLAILAAFPPLNCSCYPAVPDKYLVPKYPRWFVSQAAIDVMRQPGFGSKRSCADTLAESVPALSDKDCSQPHRTFATSDHTCRCGGSAYR